MFVSFGAPVGWVVHEVMLQIASRVYEASRLILDGDLLIQVVYGLPQGWHGCPARPGQVP